MSSCRPMQFMEGTASGESNLIEIQRIETATYSTKAYFPGEHFLYFQQMLLNIFLFKNLGFEKMHNYCCTCVLIYTKLQILIEQENSEKSKFFKIVSKKTLGLVQAGFLPVIIVKGPILSLLFLQSKNLNADIFNKKFMFHLT